MWCTPAGAPSGQDHSSRGCKRLTILRGLDAPRGTHKPSAEQRTPISHFINIVCVPPHPVSFERIPRSPPDTQPARGCQAPASQHQVSTSEESLPAWRKETVSLLALSPPGSKTFSLFLCPIALPLDLPVAVARFSYWGCWAQGTHSLGPSWPSPTSRWTPRSSEAADLGHVCTQGSLVSC